jgi:hypothetical protein
MRCHVSLQLLLKTFSTLHTEIHEGRHVMSLLNTFALKFKVEMLNDFSLHYPILNCMKISPMALILYV